MYMKKTLLTLLSNLLVLSAWAQASVTVGDQVTSEDDLVSGSAYIVQYVGNGSSGYMKDTGSAYTGKSDNDATESAVYYFTSNGDGTWQVKNYYTGNYWGTPTTNANTYIGSSTAGSWSLNYSDGAVYPSCNGHSWNRSGSNIHPWSEGTSSVNQLKIYEIALSSTAFSDFDGYDVSVSSTEASSLSTGQWYVMFDRGAYHGYLYENVSSHTLYNTNTVPSGSATAAAKYLVRLADAGNGMYYLQTGLGNYFGSITQSTAVPTTAVKSERITVEKISSTDGHFYLQSESTGIILDANDTTAGDATVVGWGSSVPTSTGGNNDWAFYPVDFTESWAPQLTEIYTINNTNSSRGALIYNPDASEKWVWSSGKSGSFDATSANSQWILCPTSTALEYYLYNVGAKKFAVPTTGGTYSGVCWKFSNDAAPVRLDSQSDGTYKIRAPYGDRYMAVSNGYEGPIINYNDVGGNFTITKVDDTGSDVLSEVNTAIGRLIGNITALTSTSGLTDGWYVIHINSGDWTGHSLRSDADEISYNGTSYALGFYGWGYEQASIATGEHLFHIAPSGSGYTWQMPNGRYLCNESNKFPVSTADASVVSIDKQTAGFRFYQNDRYATAYLLSSLYFIGETSTATAIFDIYPASLTDAGLTAWKVEGSGIPESVKLTCTRSDVSGVSSVYIGGYFFLPTDVTPESSDFELTGMIDCTVDATAHTVTVTYDPTLALTAGEVTVTQGYQTTGRGNENTLLLRIDMEPFSDMTSTQLTVTLKDETASNISSLYLHETTSTEFIANIPSTPLATASDFSTGTAVLSLGSVASGTHYYWLCATVKDDATLGTVLDAAATSMSYDCNGGSQTLDLSSVGDPSRQGAKVFEMQRFVFKPTTNSCRYYRIPAMTLDANGNPVVAIDKRYSSDADLGGHKIDVVSMRSEDGGSTWQDLATVATGDGSTAAAYGFGDAALARTLDGTLVCVMAAGSKRWSSSATDGMMYAGVARSTDNGKTWSLTKNIFSTSNFYDEVHGTTGSLGFSNLFTSSGKGLTTSDGVLMFTTNCTEMNTTSPALCYILYSTDGGISWRLSDALAYSGCDESKLEQLNDGSLLLSVRQSGNRGWNKGTYTKNADGTVTFDWGTSYRTSDIWGNACNADIIYYSRESDGEPDIMLHSYINTGGRESLQLSMSIDGGTSWFGVYNIQPNGSCYSTMEVLPDGTLALLYEDASYASGNGYAITYVTITREQILTWYAEKIYALTHPDVKVVYGTTGDTSYGSWSGTTWTSNTSSGMAGMTLTRSAGTVDKYSSWNSRYNMAYKASTADTDETLTLTAPEGYLIVGYTLDARNHTGGTTVVTAADGTTITSGTSGYTTLAVDGVNAESTVITLNCSTTSYWFTLSNFVVTLVDKQALLRGDVNINYEVNITDLNLLLDIILGKEAKTYTSDVDENTRVSVSDVTELVDILLHQ